MSERINNDISIIKRSTAFPFEVKKVGQSRMIASMEALDRRANLRDDTSLEVSSVAGHFRRISVSGEALDVLANRIEALNEASDPVLALNLDAEALRAKLRREQAIAEAPIEVISMVVKRSV